MIFSEIYLSALGIILIGMWALWIISVILKNVSIVDLFWGVGVAAVAWIYFALSEGYETRKLLVAALATIWGARLSLYLARRNIGKGEDFRYRASRERYGKKYWWLSFFQTFIFQGIGMWIISIPLLVAQFNATPSRLTVLDIAGVVVWGVGFYFEAVGDWQLMRFKADPENKGKLLDAGLWRYTRHPNYFGDAAVWWGYFLIAAATPDGWMTVYAPLLMTFLLVRVFGAAQIERTLKASKPGYAEYVARTSAFIPLPPRKITVKSADKS